MKVDERIAALARKNQTALLNALAEVGQEDVAALMGVDASTISRFKGQIEFVAAFIAALEKKMVDEHSHTVSDSRWRSVCEMAAIGVETLRDQTSEFGRL